MIMYGSKTNNHWKYTKQNSLSELVLKEGGRGYSSKYLRLKKVIISTFQQTTSSFYKCLLTDISKIEIIMRRNSSLWKIKYV